MCEAQRSETGVGLCHDRSSFWANYKHHAPRKVFAPEEIVHVLLHVCWFGEQNVYYDVLPFDINHKYYELTQIGNINFSSSWRLNFVGFATKSANTWPCLRFCRGWCFLRMEWETTCFHQFTKNDFRNFQRDSSCFKFLISYNTFLNRT